MVTASPSAVEIWGPQSCMYRILVTLVPTGYFSRIHPYAVSRLNQHLYVKLPFSTRLAKVSL